MSSQFERLNTAEELLSSVWDEFVNGSIEPDLMQTAAYCQVDINRIVWKLNNIRNTSSDEITQCKDCKNYFIKEEYRGYMITNYNSSQHHEIWINSPDDLYGDPIFEADSNHFTIGACRVYIDSILHDKANGITDFEQLRLF